MFRDMGQASGLPPTKNLSDADIIRIATEVMGAFKNAAESKGENIPGKCLVNITMKFFSVYEMFGSAKYRDHLAYEINKYLVEGLRDDYKV